MPSWMAPVIILYFEFWSMLHVGASILLSSAASLWYSQNIPPRFQICPRVLASSSRHLGARPDSPLELHVSQSMIVMAAESMNFIDSIY